MVLSIHIFCKGNTDPLVLRRRMLQAADGSLPLGGFRFGRQGHHSHPGNTSRLLKPDHHTRHVVPCPWPTAPHFPGIWKRKYNRRVRKNFLHPNSEAPLSEQIFGKALMSLTLALLSVQKKPKEANPLRKMGFFKSDVSHSNKIS